MQLTFLERKYDRKGKIELHSKKCSKNFHQADIALKGISCLRGGGSIILDSFSGLSEASLSGFYWVLMIVLILCKKNKG